MKASHFSGRHSFHSKLIFSLEAIPLNVKSHSFSWASLLEAEAIPFSGSHSSYPQPLPEVEAMPFGGRHFF